MFICFLFFQSSETDLHEQLGSLFGKDQLNRMQKRVCEHVIKSIHSEAERMKEDWKSKLGKQVKPDEQDKPQESSDEAQGQSSPDTYCFELVSMVMGLCESEVGRLFLAEQAELIRDLLVLLHVSTTRIQLQVLMYTHIHTILFIFIHRWWLCWRRSFQTSRLASLQTTSISQCSLQRATVP